MPALMGYMLAIVLMLSGYFAGLQWLITPADPWQPNPKLSQSTVQQAGKKRSRPTTQILPQTAQAITSPMESRMSSLISNAVASEELSKPLPVSTNELAHMQITDPPLVEAARSAGTPDIAPNALTPKAKSRKHKRPSRTTRKPVVMVLRTYERSDGQRFTRLLPISTRNAYAFQPSNAW
jgi:hypothetical protein